MSDQPLKLPSHEEGAVLSSTFEEAILPQYWLTAQREQSLNTGADSWSFRCKSFFFFSSFSSASTQDGTLRNQKLYIKSFTKKPAWRVSLLDLSLISLLPSSSKGVAFALAPDSRSLFIFSAQVCLTSMELLKNMAVENGASSLKSVELQMSLEEMMEYWTFGSGGCFSNLRFLILAS